MCGRETIAHLPNPLKNVGSFLSDPENIGSVSTGITLTVFVCAVIFAILLAIKSTSPFSIDYQELGIGLTASVLGTVAALILTSVAFPLINLSRTIPALVSQANAINENQRLAINESAGIARSAQIIQELVDAAVSSNAINQRLLTLRLPMEQRLSLMGTLGIWTNELGDLLDSCADDEVLNSLFLSAFVRYFKQETGAFRKTPFQMFGDVSLYAQLLEEVTDFLIAQNHAESESPYRVLIVNKIPPEYWFNWPDPRRPDKSRYALPAVQAYRAAIRRYVDAIRSHPHAEHLYTRITLFDSDTPRAARYEIPSRRALEQQAELAIITSDTPEESFFLEFLENMKSEGTLAPYVEDTLPPHHDKGDRMYQILPWTQVVEAVAHPSMNETHVSPLLSKFIEDFHPCPEAAKFVQIGPREESEFLQLYRLPADFMLIGRRLSDQTIWFVGVAADLHLQSRLAGISFFFGDTLQGLASFGASLERLAGSQDHRQEFVDLAESARTTA